MVSITTYDENDNIIEIREISDDPNFVEPLNIDVEAIAQALTQLPPAVLDSLKQALGL